MISSSIGPCGQLLDLLSYQSFDLSVGYRQIKSVPTMLVMLSYSWLIPRAYTITSLVWPMLSPCSHDGGSPVIWKFRWVVVEPIDNILISSMMLLNIKLVLETFESISFMLAHEVLVWWKEWLPLIHVHFDVSCPREFEKVCFCSFGIIPSRSCTCEEFYGLLDWSSSFHMYILAHQATDWFVQGEGVSS